MSIANPTINPNLRSHVGRPWRVARRTVAVGCLVAGLIPAAVAVAGPRLRLEPSTLNFNAVRPDTSVVRSVILTNTGDEPLVVTGASMSPGGAAFFSIPPYTANIAVGESDTLDVSFGPTRGGEYVAAVVLDTNIGSDPVTEARTSLVVIGRGFSPEIDAVPNGLLFTSAGIGVADTQPFQVVNTGLDSLHVSAIVIGDTRFAATPSVFDVAPDSSGAVTVAYTPTGDAPVTATLTIESDDYDEGSLNVSLNAVETPRDFLNPRVSLSRTDGLGFPEPGDTVSVLVTLKPNGTNIQGVEVFLAYDPGLFAPADSLTPVVRRGLTENLMLLDNRMVDAGAAGDAVHFSASFSKSVSVQGELARIDLVVLQKVLGKTLLRTLSDAPLRNTKYTTPSGDTVTLPGEAPLALSNLPPRLRPLPLVTTEEGRTGELVLSGLAVDGESVQDSLDWEFRQADSLASANLQTIGTRLAIFTPAPGVSGTVLVTAIVSDPQGGRDSTEMVLFVQEVNDPPEVPVYTAPADGATEVKGPVTFTWSANDPDGDSVTYDFKLGTNADALPVLAEGLTAGSFTLAELTQGTTYFWQVVAIDDVGVQTAGGVRQFTAEPDRIPPQLVEAPQAAQVTPTSAIVEWKTDEPSDSRVRLAIQSDFSDTSAFDETVSEELVTDHSIVLSDLEPDTEYFYQAVSADSSGNPVAAEVDSFTTPPAPLLEDAGDFNADRRVTFEDFLQFVAAFNSQEGDPEYRTQADMNDDGRVDFADFLEFAGVFGTNYAQGGASLLRPVPPSAARPVGSQAGGRTP